MERLVIAPRRDIGEYLGVVGRWAWALFGLYAAVYIAIALLAGLPVVGPAVTFTSLALILAAALLITSRSPTPLRMPRLVVLVALCVGAIVVMVTDLPSEVAVRTFVAWQLGAVNFILFVLELRARILAAWITITLVMVIVAGWSVVATGDPWVGIRLMYGQAVSLAAGTVFAIGLQRTARSIFAQQDAERDRAAVEAARGAGDAQRASDLAEVRALAGPLLQRIASGSSVERRDAVVLEAALRDRIRGRALAIEPLAGALRRARDRGVDALLLDDLGEAAVDPQDLAAAAAWSAERVAGVIGPRVTVRIAPGPAGAVVSVADADGIVGELVLPGGPGAAGRDGPHPAAT